MAELDHMGKFFVDLVVRLALADERRRYLVRHWYDGPRDRPTAAPTASATPHDPLLSVLNRRAKIRLRGRVGIYVAGGASLLAFCAALAVLDAERSSPDSNIIDFGDAIWWAVTTMTTVGYGDHYPVTATGRLVAFGLMMRYRPAGHLHRNPGTLAGRDSCSREGAGRGLARHGPAT
jgi:voltage-gated potassium channel